MENVVGTFLSEGQSTSRPPLFKGVNYSYWKARMKIFIQAQDYEMWNVIEDGPYVPTKIIEGTRVPKVREEWDVNETRLVQLNSKAMNCLYCALDSNEFNRISICESAKEIWDTLMVCHEGTSQVKESKINLYVHDYEMFQMNDNETISEMFTRFTDIINSLKSLGRSYTTSDLVRKVLRSLRPKERWQPKVTAIEEAKDLNKLKLDDLIGSLMTHEVNIGKNPSEEKKGKSLALKASNQEESDEDDSKSEDEMEMFVIKLKKFMKNKKPFERRFKKGDSSKKEPTCYECRKSGHIKPDCPTLKWKTKKSKKKAMMATWDDSDSSDSDNDSSDKEVANLCLMANESEVPSSPSSYNDELQDAFDELMDEFEKLGVKHQKLKKELISCNNTLAILKSENDSLKQKILDFDSSTSIKDLELENKRLDERVKYLDTTLTKFVQGKENLDKILASQRSVYDKAGLGYMIHEKQKEFKNFFVQNVEKNHNYKYVYCSLRKKYVKVKQVWVVKGTIAYTNTKGPKKAWVPKGVI